MRLTAPSRWLVLTTVVVVQAGCVRHSVPVTPYPVHAVPPRELEVFVDQDGTFYPDLWEAKLGGPPRRRGYSLIMRARARGWEDSLRIAEGTALQRIRAFASDKRRVFVLVHGFNNDHSAAARAYRMIKDRIAFEQGDGIFSFFWDGLAGTGVGAAQIWFPAAGYSQLAGERGLRRVLDQIQAKDVIIIAHSRGGSVTLSALAAPPYRASFASATTWIDIKNLPPLAQNGNRITALFLAPAIGDIDFRRPDFYVRTCLLEDHSDSCAYRDLGSQLVALRHTVNPRDPVLKKYVGLEGRFNTTELGLDSATTLRIQKHLKFVSHEPMEMKKHGFHHYVASDGFMRLLQSAGIRTVNPKAP
jgi:pimeloyl-ACP methyl ester carboxylesterase